MMVSVNNQLHPHLSRQLVNRNVAIGMAAWGFMGDKDVSSQLP